MHEGPVRIDKVKRPGGVYEFDMLVVGEDEHGVWLSFLNGATGGHPTTPGRCPSTPSCC